MSLQLDHGATRPETRVCWGVHVRVRRVCMHARVPVSNAPQLSNCEVALLNSVHS
jgi:hypothetical protein